jgi:integrase
MYDDVNVGSRSKRRRRGHNEGSIYQRKDGRWVGAVTESDGTRKYFYGRTSAEVRARVLEARSNLQKGVPISMDGRKKVRQFLDEWLASIKSSVRPKTYVTYEGLVRLHITPGIGNLRLIALTPDHLNRFYNERLDAGLSPQSVRHLHAVVHRALEQAARWNLVGRNVADLVTPPRIAHRDIHAFTADQAQKFIKACQDNRLGALYVLALSTGMRQGELLALRWRDVYLDAGYLYVNGTLQRTEDGLAIAAPKTAGSRRSVMLSALAIDALRKHKVRQNAERLLMGENWENNDFVFANEVGRPIEATNLLRRSFKPLLSSAGLPPIRFHDLRHSAATLLLEKGIHPKIVSDMLGHSQVGITLNLYSHVTPTMQAQAAAAMDSLLGGARLAR